MKYMEKLRGSLKLVSAGAVPGIEGAGMVRQLVLACLVALGGCANQQSTTPPDDGYLGEGWKVAKISDNGMFFVGPGADEGVLGATYAGQEMAGNVVYKAHGLTHEIEHADLGRVQADNVSASVEKLIGAMSDPNPNVE